MLGGFSSGQSKIVEDDVIRNSGMMDNSRLRKTDIEEADYEFQSESPAGEDFRDEAQEDEYDYFGPGTEPNGENLESENAEGRVDYHVMDDGGLNPDDEEMLDEDEIKARNANMLQELYDKIQQEEGGEEEDS